MWSMPGHMDQNVKEHLSMLSTEFQKVSTDYETLKEHTVPLENIENIDYIYVSNINELTHEGDLWSRFGSIGTVLKACMIPSEMTPSHRAAIIEFANKESYGKALRSSYLEGINLLKKRLRVTPIYNTSVVAANPPQAP